MGGTFTLERVRRIYDDQHGVCIEVGPDGDVGGYVEIRTTSEKAREHFGEIRLVLPPGFAALLGAAISETAEELAARGDG